MTPEQLRSAAAVMLAAADGKKIEWRMRFGGINVWHDREPGEAAPFDWDGFEYRIKPEPRKVRVQLFRHPEYPLTVRPYDTRLSRPPELEPCSDIVEIEVKE